LKYLATILSTVLILVAVLLPGSRLPDVNIVGIDKLAHFTLFTTWATAVRRDFAPNFRWPWVLATGIAYSVLTEVLQIKVEGRAFDYADILADGAGLIFGMLMGGYFLSWISWVVGYLMPGQQRDR
jgi:VanZ family protein